MSTTRQERESVGLRTVRSLLAEPVERTADPRVLVWLALSLLFATYFAGEAMRQAFAGQYIVQDDVRQHAFWMYRFLDPDLFPHDLIADYFQSIAPLGYTALYRGLMFTGLQPITISKLLPMVLGLITTVACFGVSFKILRVPLGGFLSSLIVNQSMWMQDDLVTATPRAFAYPLFAVYLYFFVRDSFVGCIVVIAIQALFYPATALVSIGMLALALIEWEGGRPHLSRNKRRYLLFAAAAALTLAILGLYSIQTSRFGPVISGSDARTTPEFLPRGRTNFFGVDFWTYWFSGSRSGMTPETMLRDVPLYGALLLPILYFFRSRFPLCSRLKAGSSLWLAIGSSIFWFFAAHALLFKLHHPNRYTAHTLRVTLSIASGIALSIAIGAILGKAAVARALPLKLLAVASAVVIVGAVIWFPRTQANFPNTKYRTGHVPELYEFFSRQPKDGLIASLSPETKNIPIFARRPILVAREYSLPFHKGYYEEVSRRASELIDASYTEDPAELRRFLEKYHVKFLMIEQRLMSPAHLKRDGWLMQYEPSAARAIQRLNDGAVPAVEAFMKSCAVFESDDYVVLDADCVLNSRE